jgi:hypothetical protein
LILRWEEYRACEAGGYSYSLWCELYRRWESRLSFLFASVGDEQNGMSLSVFSALTRLGVDLWEEAARLAALSKVLAAEALVPMIARLSTGRSQQSDNVAIAQRLVGLLPMHRHAAAQPSPEPADAAVKKYVHAIMLLVCLALAAILSGML